MLPPLCLPGCTPAQGPAGDMGNPQGSSSPQVPPPSTAAELATGAEWPVRGRGGGQGGSKALSGGEGCIWLISVGTDVNLSSVAGWIRRGHGKTHLCDSGVEGGAMPSKANRRGKAQEIRCGLQGVGFGTLYSLANNSAALYVHSVEPFSATAV